MTGALWNSEFVSRDEVKTKANLEKRAEIPATTSGHLLSRATAVNISWVTVNCFVFDVIVQLMAFGGKRFG